MVMFSRVHISVWPCIEVFSQALMVFLKVEDENTPTPTGSLEIN